MSKMINISDSEKKIILELHKKQGYGTINEQPKQKPIDGGTLNTVEMVDERGFGVKDVAITRNGKIISKKGMGSQFCYAIPASSVNAFEGRDTITQSEITNAKTQNISPWTDIAQFFRNNDLGQCKANDESGLNNPIGKYLYMGSKGPFVTTIQLKLANAAEGYAYMFMTSLKDKSKQPMDGIFGRTTASVVLEYQKDNNIKPADGRVRKNTWDRLKNISVTNNYNPQTQKWEPISGEKVQSKST